MRGVGLVVAAFLASASPLGAADPYPYYDLKGDGVFLAHISYCEVKDDGLGPNVLREGQALVEPADVNLPLAAGDTLSTPPGRRCALQLDSGAIVRLDGETTVRVEALLAPSLTTEQGLTNLVLETGRAYVMRGDSDSPELLQLLTPDAAIRIGKPALALVERSGVTALEVMGGQADVLYGADAEALRVEKVRVGQRVVAANDAIERSTAAPPLQRGEFTRWNEWMNVNFDRVIAGRDALPKPILQGSAAVATFARRWSSLAGQWVWSEVYGYLWRPDLSADPTWQPYARGRWTRLADSLYWVAQEPWGWVPSHFGLWTWTRAYGWAWIPGSVFAPAWVDLYVCDDEIHWRPWGFWRESAWRRGRVLAPGTIVDDPLCHPVPQSEVPIQEARIESQQDRGDALGVARQKAPPPPPRRRPDRPERPKLPPDMRRLDERVTTALRTGNRGLVEELRVVARSSAVVSRPAAAAIAPTAAAPIAGDVADSPRFRDWNPDVRAAIAVGGNIRYSSRENAVTCDGCRSPLRRPGWESAGSGDGSSGGSRSGESTSSDARSESTSSRTNAPDAGRDRDNRDRDNGDRRKE